MMSFPKPLNTDLQELNLISPDVKRDAEISLNWLAGNNGVETLLLMGVPSDQIEEPTIEAERERIKDFLERKDQLNWAISYMGKVVGATWVDLVESNYVQPPSVHIMIGDSNLRGRGIGSLTIKSVIGFLIDEMNYDTIYSRHLTHNIPIKKVFDNLGFVVDGITYEDMDGLKWQNVLLHAKDIKR